MASTWKTELITEYLHDKKYQLENAKEDLEEFIYNISHDLKEPLFSIGGYLSRLSKADKIDDKAKRYIDRMDANIKKYVSEDT